MARHIGNLTFSRSSAPPNNRYSRVVFAIGTFLARSGTTKIETVAGRVANRPPAGVVGKVHDAAAMLAARDLDKVDGLRLDLGQQLVFGTELRLERRCAARRQPSYDSSQNSFDLCRVDLVVAHERDKHVADESHILNFVTHVPSLEITCEHRRSPGPTRSSLSDREHTTLLGSTEFHRQENRTEPDVLRSRVGRRTVSQSGSPLRMKAASLKQLAWPSPRQIRLIVL